VETAGSASLLFARVIPLKNISALLIVFLSAVCVAGGQGESNATDKVSEAEVPSNRALLLNLASGDDDLIKQTIERLAKTDDLQVARFFDNYSEDKVVNWPDEDGNARIFVKGETEEDDDLNEFVPLFDPLAVTPFILDGKHAKPELWEVEDIAPDRKLKKLLGLYSPDPEIREVAVKSCASKPYNLDALPLLAKISETDGDQKIRWYANESTLLIRMEGKDPDHGDFDDREGAIRQLSESKSLRALPRVVEILKKLQEGDQEFTNLTKERRAEMVESCESAIESIGAHQDTVDLSNNIFQGISYGTVLILMALGLAITFGLMGVINMAHGELMMVGAYTTYQMQLVFGHTAENPVDSYFIVALPVAFLAAAIVGLIMEWLVVRHLYNRPLESLLATWGVSLILIQLARVIYGDNIGVNAPAWLSGSRAYWEVYQDVLLPYNRLYLLGLCVICVSFVYFIMRRTKQGMLMRATMQNRDMAESLGVRTRNVDRFTFALGSGIAGIAGYGWTIIGGVTPDMGQKLFIVDSFLVVVTGGVGELAGVICSGLGIGVITKMIEPTEFGDFLMGPVWAKVALLALIVAFIQFRPSGLFASKGRAADD
jgi:urea transport system permease protein